MRKGFSGMTLMAFAAPLMILIMIIGGLFLALNPLNASLSAQMNEQSREFELINWLNQAVVMSDIHEVNEKLYRKEVDVESFKTKISRSENNLWRVNLKQKEGDEKAWKVRSAVRLMDRMPRGYKVYFDLKDSSKVFKSQEYKGDYFMETSMYVASPEKPGKIVRLDIGGFEEG